MLSEQTKLELLRLAVAQDNRTPSEDGVAKFYAQFYNLIDSDPPPAKPERKARQSKSPEPEIFG